MLGHVRCRTGSLEMHPAGSEGRIHRSLPHRQLRKYQRTPSAQNASSLPHRQLRKCTDRAVAHPDTFAAAQAA